MPKITSIPTSIGGISIPGGLLRGPLQKLYKDKTLILKQYPEDLASNPARAHVVHFTIQKTNPISLTDKIFNTINQGLTKKNIKGVTEKETSKIEAQIQLYMPDSLNMTYNSEYNDISLTAAGGGAGKVIQTVFDGADQYLNHGKDLVTVAKDIITGPAAVQFFASPFGSQIQNLALNSTGQAINPQLQLLYGGIGLRSFQLDFIFTPTSQDESNTIKEIIDLFVQNSLPILSGAAGGDSGQYFILPAIFEIDFKFLKNDISTTSQIMNSIFGNLGKIGAALTPSAGVPKNGGATNIFLYKVGKCVLKSVNVDYAPNGWSAFYDGAPVSTRMTLMFGEMNIMHQNIYGSGEGQVR